MLELAQKGYRSDFEIFLWICAVLLAEGPDGDGARRYEGPPRQAHRLGKGRASHRILQEKHNPKLPHDRSFRLVLFY